MKRLYSIALTLYLALFCACEKPILADDESLQKEDSNLTLSISQLEQTSFASLTRAAASDVCTHLNFAIYNTEGTRLKQTNQKVGDSDFGTASFQLPEGSYQLVALAHSSNGNPTMTNPAKIQFTNSLGYTDTYLYHTTVTFGSEPQTLALSLHRIVALCRFVISDAIPAGVARLEFTYKGGSGHFNAATGLGVTNSTQVVKYDVQAGQKGTQYDLYTFLHETEGIIHLKVTAYDSADNMQHEREFDIPMTQNKVTWLTGDFFTGVTPSTSQAFTTTITIDTDWSGETHLTY